MVSRNILWPIALAWLATPLCARSHDLWLAPEGGALVLRFGHRDGKVLALDAARIRYVRCLRGKGPAADVLASSIVGAKELRTPTPCDVASAFQDNGYWSLTPDGERNLPRNRVPDAVRSWRSTRFAKWIDVRAPAAGAVLGDELEIVPVGDLSRLRPGDEASFRVLWQGRPAAGAVVATGHDRAGKTDAAGTFRVRVRDAGVTSTTATWKLPLGTPEADTLVAEASLAFEVAR